MIIAEVAQTHDGDIRLAHRFIDVAAKTGVDAIKFQTHIAAAESTPEEPWRVKFSKCDKTRYDYWKRMEFKPAQWKGLKAHAERKGLIFLSSPFSVEAAQMLHKIGMRVWKIASGELNNSLLLDWILKTKKPMILSTGMSSLGEIDRTIKRLQRAGINFAALQCSSQYPTTSKEVGLNILPLLRKRYRCLTGISDHSGTIYPGLASVMEGAGVVEVHMTLNRQMPGPDVPVSLTPIELETLVKGVRFFESMRANPVNKDQWAKKMEGMKRIFGKSLIAKKDIPCGKVLTKGDLTAKKPGKGIPVDQIDKVIGKKLLKPVKKNQFLTIKLLGQA